MCFSAPGSFILGAALIASGAYSIKQVKNREYLPLAMMPLFFGIQQVLEGGVWLALAAHDHILTTLFALGFLFFAVSFWPFWFPFSAYQLEPPGWRRAIMKWLFLIATVFFSAGFLLHLINYNTLKPTVLHHSISYDNLALPFDLLIFWGFDIVYSVFIFVPLFLSSLASLRFFAILLGVSLAITVLFYFYAFCSVWCLFSALMSFYIIRIIRVSSGEKSEMFQSRSHE